MEPVAGPLELAIVGAGPSASSLLERLSASVTELLGDRPLRIHVVDPHRAGSGRVWRPDLHPSLWMNSMAEDVTMFTDDTVRCAGPICAGPSLQEWAATIDDATLRDVAGPAVAAEIRSLDGMTFPTRLVQSSYLEWFHRRVLATLPATVEVVTHGRRAIDVRDHAGGRQAIELDGVADLLLVDVVVLALGHLDSLPDATGQRHARFAADHGLVYVPAGHTADLDLAALEPGADVIALGFGQAFTDLVILLTEGRGGRFVERGDSTLRYEPSGQEPVLHVGSRRGVPYRSKLDYRLLAPRAPLPRFLDDVAVERLLARSERLDFRRDVLPLVVKEVGWAYYHELFNAHPGRTTTTWDDFATRYAACADDEIAGLVAATVPAVVDRLELLAMDKPLAGRHFASGDELHAYVADHVAGDVARRTDPAFSADLGAFYGLLFSFGALGRLGVSGRLDQRSRVEDLGRWWFSFFMYVASGPPPARLRQFLALADAGLLRFVGADMVVDVDPDQARFVARSSSHPDVVGATSLVDARVASPSVSRTTDVLLRRLYERGDVVEEVVDDGSGWSANMGKVLVAGADLHVVRRDGTAHPRRHAIGSFTSRPAAGAFSRPRTNAPAFRQNDVVARSILTTLAAVRADHAAASDAVAS